MDQEAEIQVAIWQKVFQALMLWIAEIESRLDVTIPLETNRPIADQHQRWSSRVSRIIVKAYSIIARIAIDGIAHA